MSPKIASIYFSDPRQKIAGSFGFRGYGLLNSLLPKIFLMAILLGLDINKKLQAVTEEVNQNRLRDHHVSIELLEDDL